MNEVKEKTLFLEEDLKLDSMQETVSSEEILFEDTSKRSENTKHFRLRNGHYMATVYNKPVHFKDSESGEFKDLADRFCETENYYEANTRRFKALFPKKAGKAKFVTVEKDGMSVSWHYLPKSSKRKNPEAEVSRREKKRTTDIPSFPHLKYEKEDAQTDLEYGISDYGVKENIILAKCPKDFTFRFEMKLDGVKAFISEDKKSVNLLANNTVGEFPEFFIPPITMIDAAGVQSDNAHYELSESENIIVLSIVVSPEWLSAPERTYPVTIDPQVNIRQAEDIVWKLVGLSSSGSKNTEDSNILVGNVNSVEHRIFAGFNFPPLPNGHCISNASIILHQNGFSGNALYDAHKILNTWDFSSISWSNQPGFHPVVLDTVQAKSRPETEEILIDITQPVKLYYDGGVFNGIVLKQKTVSEDYDGITSEPIVNGEETSFADCDSDQFIRFYSSAEDTDYMPCLRIEYYLPDEYVDHQQKESFNAGRAGVGSINLATGKLTFVHEDISGSGGAMPISLSHIYRSDIVEDSSEDCLFGRGWMLSAGQALYPSLSQDVIATYRDAQGQKHFFSRNDCYSELSDDNEQIWYCDLRGLSLSYDGKDTIKDEKGNTLTFDDGKLVKITDTNGNFNSYTYEDGLLTRITDNLGRFITLSYDTYKLSSITDFKGRVTGFRYDANTNLTQIDYPDNTSTVFTYSNAANRTKLIRITDSSGTVWDIGHEWESENYVRSKIISVVKSGTKTVSQDSVSTVSSVDGGGIDIEYRGISTAVTDRMTNLRTVYNFDDSGRPLFSYEDLRLNSTLPPSEITVTDIREYETTKNSKTQQETSGKYPMVKTSVSGTEKMHPNYLSNGSFNDTVPGKKIPGSWSVFGVSEEGLDGVVDESYLPGYHSYEFDNTSVSTTKKLRQTVDFCENCISGNVLIASAWAKALNPVNTINLSSDAKFELRAVLTYSNGDVLSRTAQFDCCCTDWQYVAIPLEISVAQIPVSVRVEFDFSKNNGICLVSNIRLTQSWGTYTSVTYGASGTQTVFGEPVDIFRIVYSYDGINGTKIFYDKNSDAVKTLTSKISPNYFFYNYAKYDEKHRPVKTMDYRGLVTEYTYDNFGNVTKEVTYHQDTPSEKMILQADYDSATGNLKRSYDPRGTHISTGYYYDSSGELLTKRTDLNGQAYTYNHDSRNDLQTSVTAVDADCCCFDITNEFSYNLNYLTGINHNGFCYNFEYDALGRTKKVQVAGSTLVEHTFSDGETPNITSHYGNGQVFSVTSDSRGNPLQKNTNGEIVSTAQYDEQGNIVKTIDNIRNVCYNYIYNDVGDVDFVEMRKASDNSDLGSINYYYDKNRRLLGRTDSRVDQSYTSVYETVNGYSYPDNATKGVHLAGKFSDVIERDGFRRPKNRTLSFYGSSSSSMTETYQYLSVGTRQTCFVSGITNSFANETLCYTYDKSGNVETVSGKNGLLFKYTYDGLNRLVHEENYQQSKRYSYTYDQGGNILSRKEYQLVSGVVSELRNEDTYEYSSSWKDLLVSYNGQEISYDAIGNPLTYKGNSLTWSRGRKLAGYGNHTFLYDADGIRYQKNNITYTLDGDRILQETDGVTTLTYYYGANGVVGFHYNGTDYYYRKNLQGDVIAIYTAAGVLVAEYQYDAWGKILSVFNYNGFNIGSINPFRYRSYYFDQETGLYYVSSRYYDPEIGRFISPDTTDVLTATSMGLTDKNLYAYCDNNPVIRADNGGDFWHIVAGAAVGALIGGISSIVGQAVSGQKINWAEVGISAASGALTGAITTACPGMGALTTGLVHSVVGAGTYAATELVNERTPTVAGILTAGVTSGVLAGGTKAIGNLVNKGVKIQEIGRLEASNHANNPQLGVKYQINKPNGRPTIRSIEFHYNHSHNGYKLHWQQNSWNPWNNSVSSMKHWTWWGKRI